jgi:hypothetical protein
MLQKFDAWFVGRDENRPTPSEFEPKLAQSGQRAMGRRPRQDRCVQAAAR